MSWHYTCCEGISCPTVCSSFNNKSNLSEWLPTISSTLAGEGDAKWYSRDLASTSNPICLVHYQTRQTTLWPRKDVSPLACCSDNSFRTALSVFCLLLRLLWIMILFCELPFLGSGLYKCIAFLNYKNILLNSYFRILVRTSTHFLLLLFSTQKFSQHSNSERRVKDSNYLFHLHNNNNKQDAGN